MELALLMMFGFLVVVWLVFFKFKWLKFNIAWGIVSAFFELHILLIFMIGLRFMTPYSTNAKIIQHTIQLIPHLPEPTLVTAVLVEPDVPVKKGQPLFQFDHRSYEYKVRQVEAQLAIATAQQAQAIARYGTAALRAFFEVKVALTNEILLAQRLQIETKRLADNAEAVRIARLRYVAGSMDMLSVLQLQERQLESQATVIQLRYALLANRITLHLALGGSFDTAPAVEIGGTAERTE